MANKRKRKKKRQKPIIINENFLAQTVPGMLKSADKLFELDDTIKNDDKLSVLSIGIAVSNTMIIAQCCELLLKYKLQQEGKTIVPIHELHDLFDSLSDESKTEIRNIFNTKKSTLSCSLPKGWEDTDSVLKKANDAFVFWRYAVEVKQKNNEYTTIYPYPLYIAALSIYETIPIAYRHFNKEEIVDPEIKKKIFGKPTDK